MSRPRTSHPRCPGGIGEQTDGYTSHSNGAGVPSALEPARYKGAYGGRGSGKSHFFGELMVERCLVNPGTLAVCIREVQKSLLQSSKRLIESKIQSLGVGAQFQVLHDRIVTPGMD